jgi:hypothetical protein
VLKAEMGKLQPDGEIDTGAHQEGNRDRPQTSAAAWAQNSLMRFSLPPLRKAPLLLIHLFLGTLLGHGIDACPEFVQVAKKLI